MMETLEIHEAIAIAAHAASERLGAAPRCIAATRVAAEGDAPGHRQVTLLGDRPRPALRGAPPPPIVVAIGDDGAPRLDA